MSYSQPSRRPQGARQRTQDGDKRPSVSISGSEASRSYTEDGVLSLESSSQGARLSRSSHKRRGIAPPRSSTTGTAISTDSTTNTGTDHMSSRNQLVESPESERPQVGRSNSDFVPFFNHKDSRASDGFDPMVYASPSPSMASLRRESETDEGSKRANTRSESAVYTPSVQTTSLPSVPPLPARKSSMPRLLGDDASSSHIPPVPAIPLVIRDASVGTGNESDGSYADMTGTSRKYSRWDTIRKAVHPRVAVQTPPTTTAQSGLRVTPASSVISGSSIFGAGSAFSVPKAGSAISSLSEAGLVPPPSVVSSASSNVTVGSRSARAVMRNMVDQARSGVAGMSTGFSGMGLVGLTGLGGYGGGTSRGGLVMTNSMMEENTPFAKDLLQACWVARFGEDSRAPDTKSGLVSGLGHFSTVSTFGSSSSSGIRRPLRKATTDSGMVVPGGSLIHLTQQQSQQPSTPNTTPVDIQSNGAKGSLRPLHHIIVNNASLGAPGNQPVARSRTLPYQSLVLSVLLIPFIATHSVATRDDPHAKDDRDKKALENEQELAMEIFGLINRMWTTVKGPQDEVERWIWCCRAASQESVGEAIREWLLNSLQKLISGPRPSYTQLSLAQRSNGNEPPPSPLQYPIVLQCLLQHLYFVYPRVSGVSSVATQKALNSLVSKLERGGGTSGHPALLMEAIELDYGFSREDDDTEEYLREAIVAEASVKLSESGSELLRRWFLLYLLEVSTLNNCYILI
jgi:hypothetical protein